MHTGMHSISQTDCDCQEKLQTSHGVSDSAADKCSHNRCSQYTCSHNSALHNMTEVVSPAKKRSSQATESASKWLVGSSRSSTSGLSSNRRASATLLTSPPLRLSTMLSPVKHCKLSCLCQSIGHPRGVCLCRSLSVLFFDGRLCKLVK